MNIFLCFLKYRIQTFPLDIRKVKKLFLNIHLKMKKDVIGY